MEYEVEVPNTVGPGESITVRTDGGDVQLEVPALLPADRKMRFTGPRPSPDGVHPGGATTTPARRRRCDPMPPRRTFYQRKAPMEMRMALAAALLLACLHWGLLYPLLSPDPHWLEEQLCWVFGIIWTGMVIAGAIFICTDPRDPGGPNASVRCQCCFFPVRPDTKHCFVCNECICGFDHHCPYLNMCVGSRNYKLYFGLIWAWWIAIVTYLIQAIHIAVRLILSGELYVWAGVAISSAALFIPLLMTATYLIGLHCILVFKGISTYYWWMNRSPSPVRPQALTASFTSVRARPVPTELQPAEPAAAASSDAEKSGSETPTPSLDDSPVESRRSSAGTPLVMQSEPVVVSSQGESAAVSSTLTSKSGPKSFGRSLSNLSKATAEAERRDCRRRIVTDTAWIQAHKVEKRPSVQSLMSSFVFGTSMEAESVLEHLDQDGIENVSEVELGSSDAARSSWRSIVEGQTAKSQ